MVEFLHDAVVRVFLLAVVALVKHDEQNLLHLQILIMTQGPSWLHNDEEGALLVPSLVCRSKCQYPRNRQVTQRAMGSSFYDDRRAMSLRGTQSPLLAVHLDECPTQQIQQNLRCADQQLISKDPPPHGLIPSVHTHVSPNVFDFQ